LFKPDEKFLKAVINLQANPDFEAVKAGLRRYWAMLGSSFHAIDGTPLLKIQGRAGLASELLKFTDPQIAYAELETMEKKIKEAQQKTVY
jgi:hypothetical protein